MEGATMVSTISRGHLVLLVAGLGGLIATSFASINAQEAEKPPLSSTRSVPTFHEEVIGEISPGKKFESGFVGNRHLAWVESQRGAGDHVYFVVRLDGNQQGGVYDEAKYLNFNADESHFVFIAKLGSSWVLVLDAQQRPPEYTTISSITFQPGKTFYAFCACKAKKCRLVVDGAETDASYEEISYPQYSRDGKRLAFVGKRDKKWIAIVDGKETGPQLDDFSHGIVVRLRQLAGRGARGMASRQIAAETTPFFPLYVAPGMKCEDCAWVSSFHVGRLVSQSSAQPSLFRGWHTDIAEKRPTRIVRRTVKL